jgi:hypothetical protein
MNIPGKMAVLAALMICSAGAVNAETRYKTSAVAKTDFQTMDWNGGKVTVGSLKGVLETYGSSSAAMPNGQKIQNCLIRVVRQASSSDVVANCTITDADGDMLFATSERHQGDITAGSSGKGETRYHGGTGKYQDVTGGCEYTPKYLPENWLVVESDCAIDQ